MATDLERAVKREANVATLEAQLDTWSKKLDGILARSIRPAAGRGDGYRVRIDGLRARHASLQARLTRFEATGSQTWGTFKSEIATDWECLELAIEDLT